MDVRFAPGFSLAEAMAMLEGDDLEAAIYLEPPEPHVDTDEDSGPEDEGGLVDNLGPWQLLAPAEIRLPNNDRVGPNYNPVETPSSPIISVSPVPGPSNNVQYSANSTWIDDRKKLKPNPKWVKGGDFDIPRPSKFPIPNYSKFAKHSIIDIFEEFIDDYFVNHLVAESNRYALFKNCPNPLITVDEMRCFLAILIVSGYNNLPSKRHYWDAGSDMRNIAIYESMRRDRFLQISRFLHCADNTKLDETDKAWKIRPIIEMLKRKCIENFVPEENLAYDESMVKYFGRHGCKQFIRGKPIRFGYKVWSLNTKSGYLVNFELYQGMNSKSNCNYDTLFGKAASPLLILLDEITTEKQKLPYTLYMDNLFSSGNLFSYLKFRGYGAVGTVRQNRVPKTLPITSRDLFKKKPRGYFESAIERNDGLIYVRWMDNAVVTMLSSKYGTEELGKVNRYSRIDKKTIAVSRPKVIAQYNEYMGGTDQMDQNISSYRINIRGKKWYWPLFTWLIDVAVHNCWILYNSSRSSNIPQLDFRRELATVYLRKYGTLQKGTGRPPTAMNCSDSRISDDLRYDRMDHFVSHTEEKKKRRCARRGCSSIIRTMCTKCNIGLCIDCFIPFHRPG